MAAEGKDVELRIRARDYSQKTLDQVVESLQALAKAQDDQLDAAKKGEVTAKALEDAYRRIEDAARALAKQGALIKTFETQNKTLEETTRNLDQARVAQKEFAAAVERGDVPLKEQAKQLAGLAKAVERAEAAQRRAADRVQATSDRLAEYGIAATEVAGAQQRIVTAIGQANVALERQDAALQSLDSDLRKHRETTAAAAKEEAEYAASIKSVADAQARAAQEAEQFNRTRNEIAARNKQIEYERVWIGLLEQEDRKNKELQKSQQDLAAFQQAMAAQKEKETAARLEAVATAEKERAALKRLADQLAQTAKGYQTVASASSGTTGTSSLASGLKDIADPAAAALRSLNGVEQAVGQLGAKVSAIRGPVKDAQALLQGLAAAQKAAISIAGQIDGYQRQVAALRAARTEYVDARAAVAALVEQLRAGTGGDDVVSRMAAAQGKLRSAAEAMAQQTAKTRELREALRAAGVQTNDLSAAQSKLVSAVSGSKGALDAATAAVNKFGTAKGEVNDKISIFNKGERTTLSYMQRLRGEVLALATSYVGISASIGLAKEALKTVQDEAKIQSRLTQAFGGDTKLAAEEMSYLKTQSDRLGVSFRDSGLEYSKFLIAAREGNFTVQEARFIYEQFAQAASRTGQSTEEFKGVMLALTQMISKGKIGAEELTQQLAERLPGAVPKLAKALNISTEELAKRMEAGAISARAILNLAGEVMKDNATAVSNANRQMIEATGRFESAKFEFMRALADAGFTEAFTSFLNKLSALLSSPEGKQLAKDMGEALSAIVTALGFMAENFESVKNIFIAVIGLKLATWVGGVATAFASLATLIGGVIAPATAALGFFRVVPAVAGPAAIAVTGLGTAVGFLGRMIPVLGAIWAAWEIGTAVLNAWSNSAKRAREEKAKLANTREDLSGTDMAKSLGIGAIGGATPDPGTQVTPAQMLAKDAKGVLDKNQKKLDEENQATRAKSAKDNLALRQQIATEELTTLRKKVEKEVTDEKEKGELLKRIDKQIAQDRLNEQIKFNNEHAAGVQSRARKEESLITEIAREIATVEDRLKDREAKLDPMATFGQRMRARMDAIAHEYDMLLQKIGKLEKMDPKAATGLRSKVEGFVKQRQEVEAIKVKTEELQRLEKNLADTQSLRAQKLEEIQALFDAGAISQEEMRRRVVATNEVFGIGIDKAASSLKAFAEEVKSILDPTAFALLMSKVNTTIAQNQPKKAADKQNVDFAEAALNDTLERRKILLDEIQKKQEYGIITQAEAKRQTDLVNSSYKQTIIDQTTALLELIGVMRASIDPSNQAAMLVLDQMAAKVRTVRIEAEGVKNAFISFEDTIIQSAIKALEGSLDGIVNVLGEVITGQKTVAEGVKAMARETGLAFAKMIRDAALYIIKLKIIELLKKSGNPTLMSIGNAMEIGMGKKHTGGMAGSPSGSSGRYSLAMPMAIPKMHTGGVAGLRNDEVMRVLQKNEEVVTRNDPRHVLNGGTQSAGKSQRFVLVDERSRIPEAMASAEGEEVNMLWLRRNKATVKQILGN